jgi:hypothetical protein
MLTSVWEGQDPELLQELLKLHVRKKKSPIIFDATFGKGNFWKHHHAPPGLDSNPQRKAPILGSYLELPLRSTCIDVLIYDPPHIPDGGRPRPKIMADSYSIQWGEQSIGRTYDVFLREARRVLTPNGILIAKLSDQIQFAKHRWQINEFINACMAIGLSPCDLVIKARKRVGPQPWAADRQRHSWQRHSYFIIVRQNGC